MCAMRLVKPVTLESFVDETIVSFKEALVNSADTSQETRIWLGSMLVFLISSVKPKISLI